MITSQARDLNMNAANATQNFLMRTNTKDITIKPSGDLKTRLILGGVVVFVLVCTWFAVRWQFSEMFSSITRRDDPNALMIADTAVSWGPSNPQASRLRALLGEDSSSTDKRTAIEIAEQTVRLAPNDFRWRIELARILAQYEQTQRAEDEFRRAAELAPAYAVVRWHYGNFLLRLERVDEAFAQLKLAAAGNGFYRDQVFSLAWDFFGKDASRLEYLAGDNSQARTQLAYFFASRGRAEDALRNWNLLSEDEKLVNAGFLKVMAQGVFEQKHFPQALEFEKQLGIDEDVTSDAITNSSFEKVLNGEGKSRFTWQVVRNIQKLEIASDSNVKRTGNRSVRVSFRGFNRPEISNLYQIVVVQPSTKYTLRFWLRTENLKSAGTPMLDIISANDAKPIARTQPFASGSSDWQQISLDFTTPENCNAIVVRTIRAFCGEDCPLTGVFWYDDFELQK